MSNYRSFEEILELDHCKADLLMMMNVPMTTTDLAIKSGRHYTTIRNWLPSLIKDGYVKATEHPRSPKSSVKGYVWTGKEYIAKTMAEVYEANETKIEPTIPGARAYACGEKEQEYKQKGIKYNPDAMYSNKISRNISGSTLSMAN